MGPNVKFVSHICDLISERKNRGNFFYPWGGLAKDHKKYVFFSEPFPYVKISAASCLSGRKGDKLINLMPPTPQPFSP